MRAYAAVDEAWAAVTETAHGGPMFLKEHRAAVVTWNEAHQAWRTAFRAWSRL
jgi:hypothetical protein